MTCHLRIVRTETERKLLDLPLSEEELNPRGPAALSPSGRASAGGPSFAPRDRAAGASWRRSGALLRERPPLGALILEWLQLPAILIVFSAWAFLIAVLVGKVCR